MNYHGAPCPICGQTFAPGDDVVVCPDCGTPYHRSCYKTVGHCVMEELHANGGEWVNPAQPKAAPVQQETVRACPYCNFPNRAESARCEHCGYPLQKEQEEMQKDPSYAPQPDPYGQRSRIEQEEDPYEAAFGHIDPNSHIQNVSVKDILSFTQRNAAYFARLFKLLASDMGAVVFNWSALLFGPFYFLYRKMYHQGVKLLLMELASYLPSFALAYHLMPQALANPSLMETMAFDTSGLGMILTVANITSYIPFLIHAYCGFAANKRYFQHSMDTLQQLNLQCSGDRSQLEQQILRRGGVSTMAVILAVIGILVAFLAISTLISLLVLPGVL